MIEFTITEDIKEKARVRSLTFKSKLTNSIRKGEGTHIGCIGEEIFKIYYPDAEYSVTDFGNYDFLLKGRKIEIKTKERTVKPKPHYECSINAETYKQKPDYYIFISILNTLEKGWIIGFCSKEELYTKGVLNKKGTIDPSNNFKFHVDTLNIRCDQLKSLDDKIKNE